MEKLPVQFDFETTPILKKLISAHRALALLNGICDSIPNQAALVHTLALQEAKDSSEIENIITTHADIYTAMANPELSQIKPATKEVLHYVDAIMRGYQIYRQKGILSLNCIEEIQATIEGNNAGLRKLPGTALVNDRTNEIVYEPPMPNELPELMDNFLQYFNDDSLWEADPLVKMAILHFQFESIHPFYDGNGRTGRIISILYLVINDLLDLPILYLSRYITHNKGTYYRLIQQIRDKAYTGNASEWENWILFILKGVEETAEETIKLVKGISALMAEYKMTLRPLLGKNYKHELLNNLFFHPYTKIEFVMNDMMVQRKTAAKYLEMIVKTGLVSKIKMGRSNYYMNMKLIELFVNHDFKTEGKYEQIESIQE